MRIVRSFVRSYPGQSLLVLVAMIVAGLVEGVSLTALLPVLSTAMGGGGADGVEGRTGELVRRGLAAVGFAPSLKALVAVLMIGITLRAAIGLVAKRQVGYTVAQVSTDLRLELLRSLLAARWSFFLRQPIGKLANAVSFEADRAARAYLAAASMTAAAIQLVVYSWVAMLVSWEATTLYLIVALVTGWGLHRLVRAAKRTGKKQTKLRMKLISSLTDSLASVKLLKATGREGLIDAVHAGQTEELNRALRREVVSREGMKAIQEPLYAGLVVMAAWLGMSVWQLPVSNVVVMIVLLARALTTFGKVQSQYQEMVVAESGYWSVRKTIDQASREVEVMGGTQPPHLERGIRFEGVCFAYDEKVVLDDCSLEIPAGEFTTLVGLSGAGKTTVVDLVIGLTRPQRGHVWIDDVALEEIDLRAWRRLVGYVSQDTLLLHGSVLHNVTLGDPSVSEAQVEDALRDAGALDFVAALPQGVYTSVGERGARLSGGQRQRIMIARALVHEPRLLVLDEATSHLDPATAQDFTAMLATLRGSVTILAISHQSELVETSDRVYRIEKGRAMRVEELAGG